MTNVAIQRGNTRPEAVQHREWDPFRAARELFRWDPFAAFAAGAPQVTLETFSPAFEVKEAKEGFTFKADLPGVKEADLDVKLNDNRLTVSGKRESEKSDRSDTYYMYERSDGSFTRAFTLPEGVDSSRIKADLKDGVLTIELPKRPEAQPKKIAVKTT